MSTTYKVYYEDHNNQKRWKSETTMDGDMGKWLVWDLYSNHYGIVDAVVLSTDEQPDNASEYTETT